MPSLDQLIKNDRKYMSDRFEDTERVIYGKLSRLEFMSKYRLNGTQAIDLIVNMRRDIKSSALPHLNDIGDCCINYGLNKILEDM